MNTQEKAIFIVIFTGILIACLVGYYQDEQLKAYKYKIGYQEYRGEWKYDYTNSYQLEGSCVNYGSIQRCGNFTIIKQN